jgi:hypothetical protein
MNETINDVQSQVEGFFFYIYNHQENGGHSMRCQLYFFVYSEKKKSCSILQVIIKIYKCGNSDKSTVVDGQYTC